MQRRAADGRNVTPSIDAYLLEEQLGRDVSSRKKPKAPSFQIGLG